MNEPVKHAYSVEEIADDLRKTMRDPTPSIEYAAVVGRINGTAYHLHGLERLAEIDRILEALRIVQEEQDRHSPVVPR